MNVTGNMASQSKISQNQSGYVKSVVRIQSPGG
jgi:hypothetical protein